MPAQEIAYFYTPFLPPAQLYLPLVLQNQTAQPKETIIYDEYASDQNHFAPSGWMGISQTCLITSVIVPIHTAGMRQFASRTRQVGLPGGPGYTGKNLPVTGENRQWWS